MVSCKGRMPQAKEKKVFTLGVICENGKVLLGMKKIGFGKGRWNGFGGKVNPGEDIEVAAKREIFEETRGKDGSGGITVIKMKKIGMIDFEFCEEVGEIYTVHVFKITEFEGEAKESEEMTPRWFYPEEIDFDNMWGADSIWLPFLLRDVQFEGSVLFENPKNNRVVHRDFWPI